MAYPKEIYQSNKLKKSIISHDEKSKLNYQIDTFEDIAIRMRRFKLQKWRVNDICVMALEPVLQHIEKIILIFLIFSIQRDLNLAVNKTL